MRTQARRPRYPKPSPQDSLNHEAPIAKLPLRKAFVASNTFSTEPLSQRENLRDHHLFTQTNSSSLGDSQPGILKGAIETNGKAFLDTKMLTLPPTSRRTEKEVREFVNAFDSSFSSKAKQALSQSLLHTADLQKSIEECRLSAVSNMNNSLFARDWQQSLRQPSGDVSVSPKLK
jgi:hypothetical protein